VVLAELFVAVLLAGVSCVNAAVPSAAWGRSRDGRFLLLASANAVLALLGALWAWGELSGSAPTWTVPHLEIELVVVVVSFLLLATTVWPRRA
jgi:hypothetical protein